jgi:hypothetical protein
MLETQVDPDDLLKTKGKRNRKRIDPDEYLRTTRVTRESRRTQYIVEKKAGYHAISSQAASVRAHSAGPAEGEAELNGNNPPNSASH